MVFQHICHRLLLITVAVWKVCGPVWCWDRMCWDHGEPGLQLNPVSWAWQCLAGAWESWAWHKMPEMVPSVVCRESCCLMAGSGSLWSLWFCFEAVLIADPPASSAVFCFPYLDTMCLFPGESLCHRNLGLIYQHKMRLITPLKYSASVALQHQVLPQKTLCWWQTLGKRGPEVSCGCVPNVPPSWGQREC